MITRMKPPPASLPPANSKKWATRQWWDGLGYLRVRSLANPNWPRNRDIPWLIRWLRREADGIDKADSDPADRDLYYQAIAAARRYPHAAQHGITDEDAWDQVLAPIDEILTRRQARHITAVRQAQAEQAARRNQPHTAEQAQND
jgi:hypothetical protein